MKQTLRRVTHEDLSAVNHVIEAAVMSWQLPERVKRLSLPSYRYDAADLMHLTLWLVEDDNDQIIAVAGWEPADVVDLPNKARGLLLHGLYVLPDLHSRGLGQRLLKFTEQHAAQTNCDGILVKAQTDAIPFFQHQGYQDLPVEDKVRHYSHRMWKKIKH